MKTITTKEQERIIQLARIVSKEINCEYPDEDLFLKCGELFELVDDIAAMVTTGNFSESGMYLLGYIDGLNALKIAINCALNPNPKITENPNV